MRFLAITRNWFWHLALWAVLWLAFTLGPVYGVLAWGSVLLLWALGGGLSKMARQAKLRGSRRPDAELARQLVALYEGIQGAFILEGRGRGVWLYRGQVFLEAGAASGLAPRERLAYAVQRIEFAMQHSRQVNRFLSYLLLLALIALLALVTLALVTRSLGRELPGWEALLPVVAILSLGVPAFFPDLFARRHLFLADRASAQAADPQALATALSKLRAQEEMVGWYQLLPARPSVAERIRRLGAAAPRPRPAAPQRVLPPTPPAPLVSERPSNGAASFLEPPKSWRAPETKPLPEEDEPPVAVREEERHRRLRRWWRR
ncbi:MAG: hypothetical protein HY335_00290 [Deinococcus sp.]|nr:hypothetical protein [Deinococcus sp.]